MSYQWSEENLTTKQRWQLWEAGTKNHLWMVDETQNIHVLGAYVYRVTMRPNEKELVTLKVHCPIPANLLYPFKNGVGLELRQSSGLPDDWENTTLQIAFRNCHLVEAWMDEVNEPQDNTPLWLWLDIECTVRFAWQKDGEWRGDLEKLRTVLFRSSSKSNIQL